MEKRSKVGLAAAGLMLAQAVASLSLPPSPTYSGTTGDVVNDSLFAAGLIVLAGFLLQHDRAKSAWFSGGLATSALGCVLLSVAALATVAAGAERWDIIFVAGFVLTQLGWLAAAIGGRSLGAAVLMPGMVLCLAFFDAGGGLALAAAVAFLTREAEHRVGSVTKVDAQSTGR